MMDGVRLAACDWRDLPAHSRVFNLNEFEYFLYIHIRSELCTNFRLFQIDEVKPDGLSEVDIAPFFKREGDRPWIQVVSKILNQDIGQHIYKLSFVNVTNGDVVPQYISYIIQNDNPDKPYVYMNRS